VPGIGFLHATALSCCQRETLPICVPYHGLPPDIACVCPIAHIWLVADFAMMRTYRIPFRNRLSPLARAPMANYAAWFARIPNPKWLYSLSLRSRKAFPITDTELRLIAPAAIIGLSKSPNAGNKTPAATGTPIPL
jgi:hypothetical protein